MRVADLFPETLIPAAAKPAAIVAITATVVPPAPHIVMFRETRLVCLTRGDEIYVAMRPVAEGMGLNWKSQHVKLVDDSERWSVVMITTVAEDGKQREMLCIPLEHLFGWLMTIHPAKVKPAIRDNVVAYQRECSRVLARHFLHELHAESSALRQIRPRTVAVAELRRAGKPHADIAQALNCTRGASHYHTSSARRLGLLPQLNG